MSAPVPQSVEDPIEILKSSPTRDVEIQGVKIILVEQTIWPSLSTADTDPQYYNCPMDFNIQRDAPQDHLAFTKGRHTFPGAPLARLHGATGLRVLFEQLPTFANPTSRRNSRLLRFHHPACRFKPDGEARDHCFSTPMGGDNVQENAHSDL
jgi:cytochrome P450